MDRGQENLHGGSELGYDAAEHIAKVAEEYCLHQREFLQLANEPRINELHVEGQALLVRKRELEELLRRTPRPGDRRGRRVGAIVCAIIGVILMCVAFFFSLLSLEPFRLGLTGKLVCVGIALITPYAVHEFLGACRHEVFRKAIITLVFLSAVTGGALLAGVRADLLVRKVQDTTPSVVIDGDATGPANEKGSFYEDERGTMRLLMILLALAIDLGAGIAIHRAVDLTDDPGQEYMQVSNELAEIGTRLGQVVSELTSCTNAPAMFEKAFWRDFYRAMLTQTIRKAGTRLLGLSLCLVLFGAGRTIAQGRLNLVVTVDLSTSEAAKGHDQRTQFSKNIEGVGRLLGTVPGGSKVTVIGITENSFGEPYILLSAEVSDDPGYFGERVAVARQQLVRTWQKRAAELGPRGQSTDLLGALVVASELFGDSPPGRRNVLVIYSDMRHTNRELNFEAPAAIQVDAGLATVERRNLLADLAGDEVYVLGADAAGKQVGQWKSLKQFWTAYFRRAGAKLLGYSILCEPPKLEP